MRHQIMNKIIKEIGNLSKLPKSIIKYGCIFTLILFFCAAIVYIINNNYFFDNILMYNCIDMMKASTTILAEVIIGALIIDYVIKSFQS